MGQMPKLMKKKILARGDLGGVSFICSGILGSGKTSLTADITRKLIRRKHRDDRPSGERFWWRGRSTCQWTKLDGVIDKQILLPERAEVEFYADGDDPEIETRRFNTFEELWGLGDPDKLNVVYLPIERLIDFMEWIEEEIFDWNTFAIDECSDMAPYGASGEEYKWCRRVADILKETRKTRISIFANTTSFGDIQWFVLRKFMAYGFLQGARTVSVGPVWESAIRGLDVGEAWVSMGNQFEKIGFGPYKGPDVRVKKNVKLFLCKQGKIPPLGGVTTVYEDLRIEKTDLELEFDRLDRRISGNAKFIDGKLRELYGIEVGGVLI